MSENFANPESDTSGEPSVHQAANDLREAAGEKASKTVQSAEDRTQQLKDSATQKAQQFRDFAGDKATQVKEVAGEKAQQLKEAAGGGWDETRVKAQEAHADLEGYIRQHPTQSVLVAAGLGFLFGLIVRR